MGIDNVDASLVQAYWSERRRVLGFLKRDSRLKRRHYFKFLSYFFRRLLWAFGFFPVFLAFWIPLVMANFDLVVLMVNLRPLMDEFINAPTDVQSSMVDTIFIAWLSLGTAFAIFDLILCPYRSPYRTELDTHMRAWKIANGIPEMDHPIPQPKDDHSRPLSIPQ